MRGGASVAAAALLAVLVAALCAQAAAPAAPAPAGRVAVVVIDRIGISDIDPSSTPFLADLAGRWACALMVTHSAERETGHEQDRGADFVTLSAGVKAAGSREAGMSFDSGELLASGAVRTTAAEFYTQTTGVPAPPEGVVCLGYSDLVRNNEPSRTDGNVGLLGAQLAGARKRASVAGNTDVYDKAIRFAPLIACAGGAVPAGRVGGLTLPAPREPGGLRTDMPALLSEARRLLGSSDMLVVDTGDTGRVDRQSATLSDEALAAARSRALARADAFTRELAGLLDLERDTLFVVAPGAPEDARLEADYATPFIAAGRGFAPGLLSSDSTRRAGLVSNTDFAPTVLELYDIGVPSSVTGSVTRLATGPPEGGALSYLQGLDRQFLATRDSRWPTVVAYLALALLFFLVGLTCLPIARRMVGDRWQAKVRPLLAPVACVMVATPLAFLLVGGFRYESWVFPAVFCAAYGLAGGLGAYFIARRNKRLDPVTLLCVFSATVILVDLAFGGKMLVFPLLGVSSLEGLRYHGLSNAVAGLLLGYFIWGLAGLAGEAAGRPGPARVATLVAVAVMAFFVGFGSLGANVGGFVAAAATGLIFYFAAAPGRFGVKRVALVAGATASGTLALLVLDSLLVRTHAGRVVTGDSGRALTMLGRKLAILLGQVGGVLGLAVVLITGVLVLALWMKRPGAPWEERWHRDRTVTAAIFSLAAGGIIALVFNDTGITMMGTMMVVTAPAAVYHLVTTPLKIAADPGRGASSTTPSSTRT